mgnify:FL=1
MSEYLIVILVLSFHSYCCKKPLPGAQTTNKLFILFQRGHFQTALSELKIHFPHTPVLFQCLVNSILAISRIASNYDNCHTTQTGQSPRRRGPDTLMMCS